MKGHITKYKQHSGWATEAVRVLFKLFALELSK